MRTPETRTVKVVLISMPSIKSYNRWVWRAVECNEGQRGYLNERGVKVIWESSPLYRPTASRGKGPAAYGHAVVKAEVALRQILNEPCRDIKSIRDLIAK